MVEALQFSIITVLLLHAYYFVKSKEAKPIPNATERELQMLKVLRKIESIKNEQDYQEAESLVIIYIKFNPDKIFSDKVLRDQLRLQRERLTDIYIDNLHGNDYAMN